MTGGHRERVSRCAEGGPKAADTAVAKVIRADVSWIVYLIVGDAFDVTGSIEISIDCHGVTTRRAARVSEVERLVIVRSGKTASRARLTTARARAAIAADTIGLRGITRRQLARRDRLIRTAGTGRDDELDRLRSTRVSEIE